MQTSLCLIVKDEENTIVDCLAPIRDLFDDVQVMDTGSTDRTCELLGDRFGIVPTRGTLEPELCYAKFEARNRVISQARHPWVLVLDADERLSREQAMAVLGMAADADVSGYFCAWTTYLDGTVIEDYKLPLFRRDVRYSGLVHENAQQHVRRSGGSARWLHDVAIAHHPERRKLADKKRFYRQRLQCALDLDGAWYRYHWFAGYMHFRNADGAEAERYLGAAARARSPHFPVECLNSHMVLAQLHADRGDAGAAAEILAAALDFHDRVRDDFEVRVNFRLRPWLEEAHAACREGRPRGIRAYEFAS